MSEIRTRLRWSSWIGVSYLTVTLIAVTTVGCGGDSGGAWHDDAKVPLIVSVDEQTRSEIQLDSLRRLPSPPVEFAATTVQDRNHPYPILAPDSGTLIRVWPKDSVQAGDTVALWRRGADSLALVASRQGRWLPARRVSTELWPRDTVGVIEEDGFWLAEGSLNEFEGRDVHVGDPATVKLWGDPDTLVQGRVEWVRRPFARPDGRATVGVEFSHIRNAQHTGAAALVRVTPTGPTDSVLAAPEGALVRLASGFAVFIPRPGGGYEARFVFIGPTVGNLVVLRDGVEERTLVVTNGIEGLKRSAEDSLRQRAARR